MTLDLEYDVNHIASIDLDACVLWDAQQAQIGLRFGNFGPENERWVQSRTLCSYASMMSRR